MTNKWRFGCSCCGGASCEYCNDSFAGTDGFYGPLATIPSACGWKVQSGSILSSGGSLTFSGTTRIKSSLAVPPDLKYIAVRANFTLGTRIRIFTDMSFTSGGAAWYAELEAKASSPGGNRWVLRIVDGAFITVTDLGGGSYTGPVNDLLIEVCREDAVNGSITMHVPFLSATVYGQHFSRSDISATDVIVEGSGGLVVNSISLEKHSSVDPTCQSCSFEYNSGPCSQCTDTVPSVQLTLPAFTQGTGCPSGSVPCSGLQGKYKLFRRVGPGNYLNGCYWEINIAKACFSSTDDITSTLHVEIDGLPSGPSPRHQWTATLLIGSYYITWKGTNHTGAAIPIVCSGVVESLAYFSTNNLLLPTVVDPATCNTNLAAALAT